MKLKEKIEQGYVHCVILMEIVGKPAAYIRKALEDVITGMGKEKGVEIISKKMHRPKKVESVFSTFAEIELLVKNFARLVEIVYYYMPSSIEIIEPASFKIEMNDAVNLLNDLAAKLHNYDEKINRLQLEKEIFQNQLKEAQRK